MLYGNLPADLGLVDLSPTEMLFWMYCPIYAPRAYSVTLPDNLKQFRPIVNAVLSDLDDQDIYYHDDDMHLYLTAKTLWVSGDYVGNRPGWHSDGFGTKDLNYIWSDRAPTEFVDGGFELPADCADSMKEMEHQALLARARGKIVTFPDKHLLRLDQSVIHRSPVRFEAGMRTFVKLSVSKDRYDLLGNSINHDLPESHWKLVERKAERNHPQSVHA